MGLRDVREKHGLRQEDIVEIIETVEPRMTVPIISNVERALVNLMPPVVKHLAKELNVPVGALINPSDGDYGLRASNRPPRKETRRKPAKAVCRTSAEKRALYAAACAEKGVTMQDDMEAHMDRTIHDYMARKKSVA